MVPSVTTRIETHADVTLDKVGEGFEMLNDRQSVTGPGGDGQEDGQIQAAAAKLFLPGFVGHTLCHKVLTENVVQKFKSSRF